LILLLLVPLSAEGSGSETEPVEVSTDDLASKTLRFRIASATLYELRDMAKEYGLSAEGSAEELRDRLYDHFGLAPILKAQGDVTMTIEQAASAEYFTLEDGTKEIRLQGPLEVRFVDAEGTVHRMKAHYVVYNRDTREVKATGDVEYTRESTTRTDTYKGQTIAVDLDDYSGVFVDGSFNMEQIGTESRTFIVHFDALVSQSEEILSLAEGSMTACDAIDPHYILRAKKIWLFDSGDWAVADATLYVGKIPVLWLPFSIIRPRLRCSIRWWGIGCVPAASFRRPRIFLVHRIGKTRILHPRCRQIKARSDHSVHISRRRRPCNKRAISLRSRCWLMCIHPWEYSRDCREKLPTVFRPTFRGLRERACRARFFTNRRAIILPSTKPAAMPQSGTGGYSAPSIFR